jgi:hypothetical protein
MKTQIKKNLRVAIKNEVSWDLRCMASVQLSVKFRREVAASGICWLMP